MASIRTFDDPATWSRPSAGLWRMRRAQTCGAGAIVTLVGGILVGVFVLWWLGIATGAALALITLIVLRAVRRRVHSWAYTERDADLMVQHGLLIRRLSVVPYGRMQYVDVVSGPFERIFGLSTVHMHTAAAASDALIPGLASAEAQRLRDTLSKLGEAHAAGI